MQIIMRAHYIRAIPLKNGHYNIIMYKFNNLKIFLIR